jgi:hypothetical protein
MLVWEEAEEIARAIIKAENILVFTNLIKLVFFMIEKLILVLFDLHRLMA